MMQKERVISMRNIEKSYPLGNQKVHVLKGMSLDVKQGEFVAILGPSGSGKSTLMNIIGCIDTADRGEYLLEDININKRNEGELSKIRNQKIGFIFQKFNLISKYSAIYNTALPLLLRGEERVSAFDKAEKVLKRVGLQDRMKHKPVELSGGQQQRVAIARALVGKTSILLADEPTGNLDSVAGREVLNMFKELNDEGNTIIIITHDLDVAKQAKRIIHVKDGLVFEE